MDIDPSFAATETRAAYTAGLLDLRALSRPHSPPVAEIGRFRASAIATWRGRMINEFMSSFVFETLAVRALELHGDVEITRSLVRSAEEERKHGVLCGAVVEAFGGEARAEVPTPGSVPLHEDTTPRASLARNLLSIAVNETVAVSLIAAEREEMPESPLRELLTEIWSDEVGHARLAWRYLEAEIPAMTEAERESVRAYVPICLAHLEAHELAHLPAEARFPEEARAFGLCEGHAARSLFYDTLRTVIVPALRERGLMS